MLVFGLMQLPYNGETIALSPYRKNTSAIRYQNNTSLPTATPNNSRQKDDRHHPRTGPVYEQTNYHLPFGATSPSADEDLVEVEVEVVTVVVWQVKPAMVSRPLVVWPALWPSMMMIGQCLFEWPWTKWPVMAGRFAWPPTMWMVPLNVRPVIVVAIVVWPVIVVAIAILVQPVIAVAIVARPVIDVAVAPFGAAYK